MVPQIVYKEVSHHEEVSNETFKLIFILLQLFEMHGMGVSIENLHSRHSFEFPTWLTPKSKSWKMENAKGFFISTFSVTLYLFLEILVLTFYPFFPNVERSKGITARICRIIFSLSSSAKKSNKTNDREFVVKQLYQMALISLWHQPVEKHLWPPTPKWSYDSYQQEKQGL